IETLRAGLSGLTTTVTANVGPRFLHSTGQLHKGGPSDIVCLQIIVPDSAPSPQIPNCPFSFEQIFRSQYMADRQALEQLGRRVHAIEVTDPSDLLRLARA
ncbi:MAG: glucose-6-phosphate isomerase, partial [Actinomycetota bacterium]